MMDDPTVFENLELRSLLPHSGSMVLLDRLLYAGAEELLAEVTIRADSLFCQPHGVPAWIGVEYMAQAIAAYAGYWAKQRGEGVKIGFLLGTRRYEAACAGFAVGSVLQVQVQKLLQADNGIGSFECHIRASTSMQQLASATITVFQPADAAVFLEGSTA